MPPFAAVIVVAGSQQSAPHQSFGLPPIATQVPIQPPQQGAALVPEFPACPHGALLFRLGLGQLLSAGPAAHVLFANFALHAY
jgi:hypothetical protein